MAKTLCRTVVLIDAENVKPTDALVDLLTSAKRICKKTKIKAYGEWIGNGLSGWLPIASDLKIKTVEQRNLVSGKNMADMRLMIDAVDMMHTKRYDTYMIVTSDSDFTPLYQCLRDHGKTVVIVGERANVFPMLVNSGDYYIDLSKGTCMGIKHKKNKKMARLIDSVQKDVDLPVRDGLLINGAQIKSGCPKTHDDTQTKTGQKQGNRTTKSGVGTTAKGSPADTAGKKQTAQKSAGTASDKSRKKKRKAAKAKVMEAYYKIPKKFNSGYVLTSELGCRISRTTYQNLGYKKLVDYLLGEPSLYEVIREDNTYKVRPRSAK